MLKTCKSCQHFNRWSACDKGYRDSKSCGHWEAKIEDGHGEHFGGSGFPPIMLVLLLTLCLLTGCDSSVSAGGESVDVIGSFTRSL